MEVILIFVMVVFMLWPKKSPSKRDTIYMKGNMTMTEDADLAMRVTCKKCGWTGKLKKLKFCKIEGCEMLKQAKNTKPTVNTSVLSFDNLKKDVGKDLKVVEDIKSPEPYQYSYDNDDYRWPVM